MAKVRVYQLAKELGMESKELVNKLNNELDISVKNASSGLTEKQVMIVKEFIKPIKVEKKKPKVQKIERKEKPKETVKKIPVKLEEKPKETVKKIVHEAIKPKKQPVRRKTEVRILTPEEIAKHRRKHFVRKGIEAKPSVKRPGIKRPAAKKTKVPMKEQLEKLVATQKQVKEKPKTLEEILAEKKREQRELEDQRKLRELMKKLEEKNRAKKKRRKVKKKQEVVEKETVKEEVTKTVLIPETISVKELAEKLNVEPNTLLSDLIAVGKFVTINQLVDFETASKLAEKYDKEAKIEENEEQIKVLEEEEEEEKVEEKELKPRPPIVVVMGHVDHGKTTLLDYIRKTHVAKGEAGGITQHIGASVATVNTDEGKREITFLDTPGHEAFTAMRARGAQVTDLATLVVAADDGVMPQTVEAINHAKSANIPIIVAINKIDKPNANPDRVKQELTQYNLVPEEWGGDTLMVDISAKTGQGVDELLEVIALQSELLELKANPKARAKGVVLEARLDKQKGPIATFLVKNGTLRIGDAVVVGTYSGKVRAMFNENSELVKQAGPSIPVEVLGINGVPNAGDRFFVVDNEKRAREIAEKKQETLKKATIKGKKGFSLEELFGKMKEGNVILNIILKADVQGSIEAIKKSIEELSTDEVKANIIHTGVGAINENDVMLASASHAIIIGFNVRPDSGARKAAEKEKVDVRTYRVIYDIVNDMKKAMQGLLKPEEREVYLGSCEVRATFKVPNVGMVAGCYVKDGIIKRNANARLVRDGKIVFEGKISSLKRFKEDVKEVQSSYECGVGLENFNDIKVGDTIECFTKTEVERKL